jgi:hypothetical protein
MYRCVTEIYITQVATEAFPKRNKALFFDFVSEFECSDSWADFTNKAKITFPKNIYYIDQFGKKVNLGNTNANIGGFSNNEPVFLRGDMVKIIAGYSYFDKSKKEIFDTSILFTGFISRVTSKKPIVLECEDNMWKLKQIPAPNKLFPAKSYTLESILKELLKGTPYKVNTLTQTSIGDFRTQNETVCDVLARIRKDYHFESYFREDELRCGSLVYIESEAKEQRFAFQKNIISDELDYQRKDDVVLSAIAYSINKKEIATLTKKGKTKTKKERLEVLVTEQNGKFTSKIKTASQKADFAPNNQGERRTLYFWNVTDANALIKLATEELQKYYYTGLKGKFTTFGIPFVRQGDNAIISDTVLPERNGGYKIKSVEYSGGVNGLRQVIQLDYKLPDDKIL